MKASVPDYEKVRQFPDRSPSEQEVVTITCVACGGHILTVPRKTAEAFGSGSWTCSRAKCHENPAAVKAAAEGRLV